eukprot:354313-Chlamydomonas_euryale.AAC.3
MGRPSDRWMDRPGEGGGSCVAQAPDDVCMRRRTWPVHPFVRPTMPSSIKAFGQNHAATPHGDGARSTGAAHGDGARSMGALHRDGARSTGSHMAARRHSSDGRGAAPSENLTLHASNV